jgi:hypothetical protein
MIKHLSTQPESPVRFSALFLLAAGFNRRIMGEPSVHTGFNRRIMKDLSLCTGFNRWPESKNASLDRLAPVLPDLAAFASIGLDLAQRLNAASAKPLGESLTLLRDSHFLDVDVPLGAGGFLRPGTIVAKLRAFATIFALSHDSHSLIKKVVDPFGGVHARGVFTMMISQNDCTKTTKLGSTSSLYNC